MQLGFAAIVAARAAKCGKNIEEVVEIAKETIVHHINCYDQAKELANKLKEKLNMNISIVDIGPVIGVHVGPGAIGVAYYTEKEIIQ